MFARQFVSAERLNCSYHSTLCGIFEYLLKLDKNKDKELISKILNNPNASFIDAFNRYNEVNIDEHELLDLVRSHQTSGKYDKKMIQTLAPTLRKFVHELNSHRIPLDEGHNAVNNSISGMQNENVHLFISYIFGINIRPIPEVIADGMVAQIQTITPCHLKTSEISASEFDHMLFTTPATNEVVLVQLSGGHYWYLGHENQADNSKYTNTLNDDGGQTYYGVGSEDKTVIQKLVNQYKGGAPKGDHKPSPKQARRPTKKPSTQESSQPHSSFNWMLLLAMLIALLIFPKKVISVLSYAKNIIVKLFSWVGGLFNYANMPGFTKSNKAPHAAKMADPARAPRQFWAAGRTPKTTAPSSSKAYSA